MSLILEGIPHNKERTTTSEVVYFGDKNFALSSITIGAVREPPLSYYKEGGNASLSKDALGRHFDKCSEGTNSYRSLLF